MDETTLWKWEEHLEAEYQAGEEVEEMTELARLRRVVRQVNKCIKAAEGRPYSLHSERMKDNLTRIRDELNSVMEEMEEV